MDPSPSPDTELRACLDRLARGDLSARERILQICNRRLHALASRLLNGFPNVRRWDTTGDVAQNAALRLHRALAEIHPSSVRGLMGLLALQIQRELLDLARKYAGPTSFAANHDTNVRRTPEGRDGFIIDAMPSLEAETIPLERWERFHRAVEDLPQELREVFRMAWYLGLDQTEVASTLACSVRTVGRRWQEARQRLQQAVNWDLD
jgi:RNA polymerase sigma factor (sigma-70 family)